MGSVMKDYVLFALSMAAAAYLVTILSGCSYQTLTGEQGYEWAFRMNPISKREEQQEFKPVMKTFSRSDFDGSSMPK
jgi:hypothetical protein